MKHHFLILLMFLPEVASAQLDTTKIYQLGEVCYSPKRIKRDIVPYQGMDSTVLANLSCQSVADAIRYFSGVQIKDYGGVGGIKTINVRSMGTNQMGVFYDGIQLGNAQNGQVDLGRFSLDNIEAIDLYNGQRCNELQSAKDYGAAGTIYLTTKKPTFQFNRNYNVDIKMKAGSFGLVNPSITYNQKLGKKMLLNVSAEYTYADGKYNFTYKKIDPTGKILYDTTAVRENADITAVRTEAALFGDVKNGEWKLRIYNFNSYRGLPGHVVRNVFKHEQRQWDNNLFIQGSYMQKYLEGKLGITANAKYAFDYTRYLNPDLTLQYIDNSYYQQEAYISGAANYQIFHWWNISVATDFQYNYLDANVRNFVYPSRYTEMVAVSTTFKHPNVKFQASVLGTFVQENTRSGTSAQNCNEVTPAAIISVRPWSTVPFDIRAFYKRIFRMPTFNDLYYTNIGNANLEPEYVNQYDAGITYQYTNAGSLFANFSIQADGYYNYVENKIVAIPAANLFRWQMKNYGKVQIYGADISVDLGLEWANYWTLDIRLAYAYQVAADLSYSKDSKYYGGQLPYTPWHSGSATGNLSYKGFNLNYSFIYTGERYESSANIPVNYVQPWYTHDISLSYTHNFNRCKLKASIQVNNLFNQQYEVVKSYPMPGTNFRAILNFVL